MTRETKSYELKIYDQSLMRFEAAYDAFGSLKLEITDIDSANAHLLPLNLIVDQDEKSDADLYSAQKTAEGVSAKAKAEAEATRLKGEADGAAEKAHGEGVAAGIKAQTEAYNGMENAYLLANRYIDVMPEVAEAVAKPLTAVDSIKMYGDGNATKLVRDTTGMVDQVTSGLKDATGIDLTELLSSFHQPFQPREDNE